MEYVNFIYRFLDVAGKSTEGKDLDYIWFAKCEGFVFLNNDCQLLLNYLQSIGDACFFQQFFIISFSGATPKI